MSNCYCLPGRAGGLPILFTLDGITGSQREYILWLLKGCTEGKIEPETLLTADAIDLLASKLRTPLQVQHYLTLALEAGYQTGEQPLSADLVESVLSRQRVHSQKVNTH